jgi:hypothetical protein
MYKFFVEDSLLKSKPVYQQDTKKAFDWERYTRTGLPYLHLGNLPEKFSVSMDDYSAGVIKIQASVSKFATTFLAKSINDYQNLAYLKDKINHTNYGLDSVKRYTYAEKNVFSNSIYSQPTDSLFKPMMHRSDNFFAEQTLLMASNEHLGFMNDQKIIDTILKTDLKDIPQRPKWVDGSGLSRYNLFTPQSIVYLLNKLKKEFSWNRLTTILATGGEGTISNYFIKDRGFIYAKTGTLSNNCALSGFLITKSGKCIIFSILANNFITGATPVRKAVERFLDEIREKY